METSITNKELNVLLKKIQLKNKNDKLRDNKSYSIEANGKTTTIDLQTIPDEHKELFNSLVSNLKPIKY